MRHVGYHLSDPRAAGHHTSAIISPARSSTTVCEPGSIAGDSIPIIQTGIVRVSASGKTAAETDPDSAPPTAGVTPQLPGNAAFDPQKTVVVDLPLSGVNLRNPAFPDIPGYQIVSELGRGGMGVVYRARQLTADRDVALKMIRAGDRAEAEYLLRFRAETSAVTRLQHPQIVAVYDVNEFQGQPYFSMEYCGRGSLAGAVRGTVWGHREAAEMLRKIAKGVGAAHAVGIVHRDLKPQNILLTADGEPKVSDFGLAKQLVQTDQPGLTESGAVLGTPSYMAPEQAFGSSKTVGFAADIYSLGAILYELLTGRPPFVGPSTMDIMVQVVTEEPIRLRQLRKDVPRDLEQICLKCLEKDPRRRYATADALAEDLSRFLAGDPVSIAPAGILNRLTGALDRVQLQERFASYSAILTSLAPVMFLPEIAVTLICWFNLPGPLVLLAQVTRVLGFLAVFAIYRRDQLLPQNAAERHLWTLWCGYIVCCVHAGLATRLALGIWETSLEPQIYIPIGCLTALAFFVLSSTFWGQATFIGLLFLGVTFLMAIDLRFAPLEFGATWAIVLLFLGQRLRRLAQTSPPGSTESAATVVAPV